MSWKRRLLLGAAIGGAAILGACQKPAANTAASAPAATPASAPAPPPIAGADVAGAKAFLEGLYAHYRTSKNNNFQMFDADRAQVFDPDTIALLDADTKALNGEVGAIDGDWLCDCQDFESLKATIAVQSATPAEAHASADFIDVGGVSDAAPGHADFDLVKTAAGWRIHDITLKGQPSLRRTLQDEIKQLKSGAKAADNAGEAP